MKLLYVTVEQCVVVVVVVVVVVHKSNFNLAILMWRVHATIQNENSADL